MSEVFLESVTRRVAERDHLVEASNSSMVQETDNLYADFVQD